MNNLIENYNSIISKLNNSNNIAVISHMNPDGDTLGSALALYQAFTNMGKTVHLYCADTPSTKYSRIPNVELFNKFEPSDYKYDMVFAVDCATIDRLSTYKYLFRYAKFAVQIDHHITNDFYAKHINIVEDSAANCQNIANFLFYLEKTLNIKVIDKVVAECIYTGLLTDTGAFSFTSVTPETLQVASKILSYGIDHSRMVRELISELPFNVFRLKQRCINNARFYDNETIAISVFTPKDFEETNTDMCLTDGLIQNLISIEPVKVAVCLTEKDEYTYKCSIRTKDGCDAKDIATVFNGGGHMYAAGCQIKGHIEDVKDKLLKAIRDRMG